MSAWTTAAGAVWKLFGRSALRRLRHPLPADPTPEPLLVQFAARRVRDLPRLRPRDRPRLRPRRAGRSEDAARRRGQAVAERFEQGVPGRSREVCEEARHSARYAMARAHARAEALGARRRSRNGRAGASRGPASGTASRAFFKWLETKAYKMHVRVLLSKYRAYTPCETCGGARLKPRRSRGGSARARTPTP